MRFKQWLEMIGFHGSPNEFDEFQTKYIGSSKKTTISDLGFFFAPTPEEANVYADMAQRGGGYISQWELTINRPYNMPLQEFMDLINWGSLDSQKYKTERAAKKAAKETRARLEAEGYDGIFIRNREGAIAEIVIFNPQQAKKIDTQPGINMWER